MALNNARNPPIFTPRPWAAFKNLSTLTFFLTIDGYNRGTTREIRDANNLPNLKK